MVMMNYCFFALLLASLLELVVLQQVPAEIIQDARVHPLSDGTFGFLYKTEDGIAHGAKGDSNGIIHGRYTYTDDTGFKFSSLYNAGLGVVKAPGTARDSGQYDDRYHLDYENQSKNRASAPPAPQRAPQPSPRYQQEPIQQQPAPQPQPQYRQAPQQTNYDYNYDVPVTRPQTKYPQYFEDDFQQTFQQPQQRYQQQPRYTDTNYEQPQNYGGGQSRALPRYEGPSVPSQNIRSRPPALRGNRVNQYQQDYDYK